MGDDSDDSQQDPNLLFPMSEEAEAAIDDSNEETEATTDDSSKWIHRIDWDHPGAGWFIAIVYCAVMIPVYFYIVQPVLVDFSSIFAYEGSIWPGPRSLGELMFFAFLMVPYLSYASIRLIHEFGVKTFFFGISWFGFYFVFLIPLNMFFPGKYLPNKLNLSED